MRSTCDYQNEYEIAGYVQKSGGNQAPVTCGGSRIADIP